MVRAWSFVRPRSQFDPDVQAFQLTGEISSRNAINAAPDLPEDLRSQDLNHLYDRWRRTLRGAKRFWFLNPAESGLVRPERY